MNNVRLTVRSPLGISCLRGVYAHLFFILAQSLKGYDSIDFRKDGVILTYTHIIPWMDARSPLSDDD